MKKLAKILSSLLLISSILPVNAFEKNNSYRDFVAKDPNSSYIFVFVYRSAAYLDWSSPSNLTKTTLVSQISRRIKGDASSIGHAQIGWHCNLGNGKYETSSTGQTGQNGDEGFKVVRDGWGLGVLDTVFTDGHLESDQEVMDKMKAADKNGNFAWMAIKTNKDSCMDMVNFVKAYDKSGAAINYGFPVEPLKFEGAGCTSFTNAAMSQSKLDIGVMKGWIRKVKIPFKYMGKLDYVIPNTRPLELAKTKEEVKKVPMTDFLFGNINWAKDNEPHKDFYYYDPELFYESLIHAENKYREEAGMNLKNPIRTKEYDPTQLNTKKVSEKWIEKLFETNKRVKLEKIHNSTGLVVEL